MSYCVYSSMSFYDPGDDFPGPWFVAALGALGHPAGSVRQTLFRMERSGELVGRRAGRTKHYRLTPLAQAEAAAGSAKIFDPVDPGWDGDWTVVQFRFGVGRRVERERVTAVLRAEGFAGLAPGVFLHPRDRVARVREALGRAGLAEEILAIRGRRQAGPSDAELVARHWPLADLANGYRRFLARFGPVARTRFDRFEAFAVRFAMVFGYLEVAWIDPDLPLALLPPRWPGERARAVAQQLYRQLLPGATGFAEEVMDRVTGRRPVSIVA